MVFVLFTLFCHLLHASTKCLFFIGDGNFFKPQVEKRFLVTLESVKKNWDDCSEGQTLISLGDKSQVYDYEKGSLRPLDPKIVTGDARKDNLYETLNRMIKKSRPGDMIKNYFGDHGKAEGTMALDGNLTSVELRDLYKKAKRKGLYPRAVFDHCYSGNMLDAFYDLETGEVFGCGMSTGNNTISFQNDDVKITGSIKNKSELNQMYYGKNPNLTTVMSSSDRFLEDYARSKLQLESGSCGDYAKLEEKFGFKVADFDKVAFDFYFQVIQSIDASYQLLTKNSNNQALANAIVGYDPKGYANALKEYQTMQLEINRAILVSLKSDPIWGSKVKKKASLHDDLVLCTDTNLRPIEKCDEYNEYMKVSAEVNSEIQKFKLDKKVGQLFGATYGEAFKDKKLVELEEHFLRNLNSTRIYEIYFEKRQMAALKKLVLLEMIKNKDLKALQAYKELYQCEVTTYL